MRREMTPREARMASDFELQQAAEMGDEFAYLELQDRIIYWEEEHY